jgi:7-cyano-7-deazaguanine synthase in queuosine biosynthesis
MKKNQGGQSLVMLLFFVMVGIAVATAAMTMVSSNSLSATDIEQGEITRVMAETGVERAILQILRNGAAYTGETLTNANIPEWDDGWKVDVTVTDGENLVIYSVATAGKYQRKVEVAGSYVDNELMLNTWKEIN